MGAATRLMLAHVITDAKTNFFIQYSWEMQKSSSVFKTPARGIYNRYFWAVEDRGDGNCSTSDSNAVLEGL
jgi:hypothetical protein